MKRLEWITKQFHWVSAVLLFVTMLLVAANVIARRGLNMPILAAVEVGSMLTGVAVAFAFAQTQLEGRHIKVDIVTSHLKPLPQAILKSIGYFIVLFPIGMIAWGSFLAVQWGIIRGGDITTVTQLPIFVFRGLFGLGVVVFWVAVLSDFINSLLSLRRKQ